MRKFDTRRFPQPQQQPEGQQPEQQRVKARRLISNPFERKALNEDDAAVKRREFPQVKENRISDIKKRYSQLIGLEEGLNQQNGINNVSDGHDLPDTNTVGQSDSTNQGQNLLLVPRESKPSESPKLSPSSKKKSIIKLSSEKLNSSKERLMKYSKEKLNELTGQKKDQLSSVPSKADMQNYLISQVLFDGQKPTVTVQKEDPAPAEETTVDEFDDGGEALLDEAYLKEMEKYLWFLEDKQATNKRKKKKKQKQNQPAPALLKATEIGNLKKQFENKRNVLNKPDHLNKPKPIDILIEQNVGKVKNMFESSSVESKPKIPEPSMKKVVARTINKDLISKFDRPEMADELRVKREQEREERKQLRLQKLAEEKKRLEELQQEALRQQVYYSSLF